MPKRITSRDRYICVICNKLFQEEMDAKICEGKHELIYVPFEKGDLRRLLDYIITGNPDYLTQHLIDTLMQYNKLRIGG